MDIALDGGNQELGFGAAFAFGPLHQGLEEGHGRLHGFGALQHKGQLHLAGAKQLTHHLHAIEQEGVDDR